MFYKYLKLSLSTIFITASIFSAQIPEAEIKIEALPFLEKPAPCINRPIGEFQGVCGQIARFQVFYVGLKELKKLPHANSTPISGHASKLIHDYFNHASKGIPFDITKHAKSLFLNTNDNAWRAPPLAWNFGTRLSEELQNSYLTIDSTKTVASTKADNAHFYCGHFSLEHNIFAHDINLPTSQKAPQFAYLSAKSLFVNEKIDGDPQTNQYHVTYTKNHPAKLIIDHGDKKLNYSLVGTSLSHIYASLRLSPIAYIMENIAPSTLLMCSINRQWVSHVDAYVRYGQTWYVMDDETRWKAQSTDNNGNIDTNPEQVAHALTQHYPGDPSTLLYELTEEPEDSPDPVYQPGGSLLLERDTPRPIAKACLALIAAPLIDGLAGGLIFGCGGASRALLDKMSSDSYAFPTQDIFKYSAMFGTLIAGLSFYHHLQHIRPMFKKKIQYKHIQGTKRSLQGPRAPLFSL